MWTGRVSQDVFRHEVSCKMPCSQILLFKVLEHGAAWSPQHGRPCLHVQKYRSQVTRHSSLVTPTTRHTWYMLGTGRAKQSRAEQSRAEQSRAEQSRRLSLRAQLAMHQRKSRTRRAPNTTLRLHLGMAFETLEFLATASRYPLFMHSFPSEQPRAAMAGSATVTVTCVLRRTTRKSVFQKRDGVCFPGYCTYPS
jgi:hypothetical protein